ncbi:MAG: hypothetical protein DRN04_11215 [Thermoprotei archaeon]|nr:MAG: hypothetical protein DRN04_11215 [Thermoprotei archaeon]
MLYVYFRKLDPAIKENLTSRFKEFFNVREIADLFRGHIIVKNSPLSYFIKAEKSKLAVKFSGYEELEVYVKNIEQERLETFLLDVGLRCEKSGEELRSFPYRVEDPADIHSLVGVHLLPYALLYLYPLSFGVSKPFLLTDSRAGILRLARTAVATTLEYGRLLVPARESAFLAAYNRLAVRFREKGPLKELEKPFKKFLAEIGLKNIEVRLIGGYPEIYVEDIWGKKLPLEECPGGVRESLSAALALVTEDKGLEALFIEEIESHIHPRA